MSQTVKKKSNPILIILLLVLGIWLLSQIYTEETPAETTNPTEYGVQATTAAAPTAAPTEEGLPGVPEQLKSHLFLEWRGQGSCEYLTGDIVATMILVSDGESSWSAQEIETLKQEQLEAAGRLSADAADYGTYVRVRLEYLQVSVGEILNSNAHALWRDTVLAAAGLPGYSEIGAFLEARYGTQSAPIFFYLNKMGRSFAQPALEDRAEYSVVYLRQSDFRHELNHLYGAKDYYFPQAYQTAAEQAFSGSIMLEGGPEAPVDSLTAYLLGWTDTLSPEAQAFLEQTANVTQDEINRELAEETYTGYTTKTLDYGVYTGDLVGGIFQGTGKLVYNTGDVYEGQWNAGTFHGQGTYQYTDGGVYTGGWNNGSFHGEGTFRFANGTVYTGQWSNGERHGQGTLQYADGAVYTGQWENGKMSGYGVLRWASGDVYEGYWANDAMNGQGTLTKADGTVFSGTWKDSAFVQ